MTMRTHYCGELRSSDIGSTVTVCGWVDTRRVHSEHLAFIDLRDHTGIIQCVVDEKLDLRSEFVVSITGTVRSRFEGKSNEKLSTGEVELGDCSVELLSSAEPPPFPMHERSEVDENIRLRHRYLDLRKTRMQKNLRIRAQVNSAIRNAMEKQGFVEIETAELKFKNIKEEVTPITTRTTRISIKVKPLLKLLHPVTDVCVLTSSALHTISS